MSADINDELVIATAAVKTRHFDALEAAGIYRPFLFHGAMKFGVARVETDVTTYEPSPTGTPAVIMPARPLGAPWEDFDDDIIDLIAFRLSEPRKWWTRLGMATVMNPDAIDRAEIYREPLEIHSTPLAWLRSEGKGAVILDDTANLSLLLGNVREIICDTLPLARRVDEHLHRRPALPEIHVKANANAEAAA